MLTREDLTASVGQPLGTSSWIEVDQEMIDSFGRLTLDEQPIHHDPAVGEAAGMGGTIAHGFLTMSLLSVMSYEVLPKIERETASLNYGFDRVRFVAPVRGGTRIRGHFTLTEAIERGKNGLMLRFDVSVEIEGEEKPALTADWLGLYLFEDKAATTE